MTHTTELFLAVVTLAKELAVLKSVFNKNFFKLLVVYTILDNVCRFRSADDKLLQRILEKQ